MSESIYKDGTVIACIGPKCENAELIQSLRKQIKAETPTWISGERLAQFWINATPVGECWEWHGSRNKNGYGTFRVGEKVQLAHRISYALTRDGLIENLDTVAHVCDNPCCIKPEHLFHTDHHGNMIDRQIKGRARNNPKKVSKYYGVYARTENDTWRAMFSYKKKNYRLGTYRNEIDAARAVNNKLLELMGEEDAANLLNSPLPNKEGK